MSINEFANDLVWQIRNGERAQMPISRVADISRVENVVIVYSWNHYDNREIGRMARTHCKRGERLTNRKDRLASVDGLQIIVTTYTVR